MPRTALPNRRQSVSLRFEHAFDRGSTPFKYDATVGFTPDGKVGEVFLNAQRYSTALDAYARDAAIAVSIAIQHGVPVAELRGAMTRNEDGAPASPIGALLDLLEAV